MQLTEERSPNYLNAHAKLRAYQQRGHLSVAGWLEPFAIKAIINIDQVQKESAIMGGICEIGVHKGRLLILLHLLSRETEQTVGFDLFELMDDPLVSSYGVPDKEEVFQNLLNQGCDLDRVKLISADSTELSPSDILTNAKQRIRMFSIDGGHDAQTTFNDMVLAINTVESGGVVFVDDVFNEQWCGVVEGVCEFLSRDSKLIPFLQTGNKMFFTTDKRFGEVYQESLKKIFPEAQTKVDLFFGNAVLIIWPRRRSWIKGLISQIVGERGLRLFRQGRKRLSEVRILHDYAK